MIPNFLIACTRGTAFPDSRAIIRENESRVLSVASYNVAHVDLGPVGKLSILRTLRYLLVMRCLMMVAWKSMVLY